MEALALLGNNAPTIDPLIAPLIAPSIAPSVAPLITGSDSEGLLRCTQSDSAILLPHPRRLSDRASAESNRVEPGLCSIRTNRPWILKSSIRSNLVRVRPSSNMFNKGELGLKEVGC
jgi:hypothetical protein